MDSCDSAVLLGIPADVLLVRVSTDAAVAVEVELFIVQLTVVVVAVGVLLAVDVVF